MITSSGAFLSDLTKLPLELQRTLNNSLYRLCSTLTIQLTDLHVFIKSLCVNVLMQFPFNTGVTVKSSFTKCAENSYGQGQISFQLSFFTHMFSSVLIINEGKCGDCFMHTQ